MKDMQTNLKFPVIEVTPSGKPEWYGGAWCLVWVYATNGNFLLKGFKQECEEYIEKIGWKCWAIYNLYHTKNKSMANFSFTKKHRTIISSYKCDFSIYGPSNYLPGRMKPDDYKFHVYSKKDRKKILLLKRLPQQFVEFKFEN